MRRLLAVGALLLLTAGTAEARMLEDAGPPP